MAVETQTSNQAEPRLAQYLVRERLGRGGMGVVYQAWDLTLEREVALKVLPGHVHSDPERRARFLREARAAARLNHPNIATVYEVAEAELPEGGLDPVPEGETHVRVRSPVPERVLYIAMELVPGQDLEERLTAGPLSEPEALDVTLQILDGLDAAHRAGVVHRDLKPQNLRVTPDGRVKILDFGLAKVLRESRAPSSSEAGPEDRTAFLTQEGMILGTAPYMSPEQVQGGDLDARSDLFALGVMLYRMVSGELPFESSSLVRYVRSLASSEPKALSELRPGISPQLEKIVECLLARDPEDRCASAAAVRDDLEELASRVGRERSRVRYVDVPVDGLTTPSGVSGGRRPSWGRRTLRRRLTRRKLRRWRKRLTWGSAAAAVTLLVFGAWWTASRQTAMAATNVAVLPFENQTDDPTLDAYYEGIGAALIRKLSRVPGVNVVSELDVRRYRDTEKTLEEVARELDVGTMILGYVQGGREEIVVEVQSQSTQPVVDLWTRLFRGAPDDLLRLQEDIVDAVLRNLPITVSRRERRQLRRNPTESRRAWSAYFRGSALLEQVDDAESLRQAAAEMEAAVEADPGFAWAHAGLSEALWRLFRKGQDPEPLERAAVSARRAVELEPETPDMWVAEARVLRDQGDYEASLTALDEALRLNPLLDTAHREKAITAWDSGNEELASASFRRATEIRPTYWGHWNEYGVFLLERSRYDAAREALETARELAPPGVDRPRDNLLSLALIVGDSETARSYLEEVPVADRPSHMLYGLAIAYDFEGQPKPALRWVEAAIEKAPEPTFIAFAGDLHLKLGEPAAARRQYGRALRIAEQRMVDVRNDDNLVAQRVYLLARLERCDPALSAAKNLQASGALPDELNIVLARSFVVCERPEAAKAVVSKLLSQGVEADRLKMETELVDFL